MVSTRGNNQPIGTINEDTGIFNIQVQTHTLRAIENYLFEKLDLNRETQIFLKKSDSDNEYPWNGDEFSNTFSLNRTERNYFNLRLKINLGSNVDFDSTIYTLRTDPQVSWNGAKFSGNSAIPISSFNKQKGYEDLSYPNGIDEHELIFQLDLPNCDIDQHGHFDIICKVNIQDLNGDVKTEEFKIKFQQEEE